MAYTYYKTAALSGGWHEGRLGYQLNSQNQANNTSNITIRMEVHETTNASSYNLAGTANFWLKLNGTTKVSKTTFDWRSLTSTWILEPSMTWTGDVAHAADGTCSITIQGYMFTNVGAGTYAPTAQSITLPTIPRESLIGTPTLTLFDNTFSVPITHYTGYDRLILLIGSTVIKTIDGYTSGATITLSDAEGQAIYTALGNITGTMTFQLKTYTTSAYTTQIGSTHSTTKSGTFSLPTTVGTFTWSYLEQAFTFITSTPKYSWYYHKVTLTCNSVLIKTINGVASNDVIQLTDAEILAVYNAAKTLGAQELTPPVVFQLTTYAASNMTHQIDTPHSLQKSPSAPGTITMKVAGVWKQCVPYIKVAGVWQKCLAYQNIAGTWKRGI